MGPLQERRNGGYERSTKHAKASTDGGDLAAFWVAVLLFMGIGAGILQVLGPPAAPPDHDGIAVWHSARWPPGPANGSEPVRGCSLVAPVLAGRDTPGPIADPDPALLEPLTKGSQQNLPRIASDGRLRDAGLCRRVRP